MSELGRITSKLARDMSENLDNWIRAVFLYELGPDSYGKSDLELATEAGARGYKLARDVDFPFPSMKYAILDKNDKTISSYVVNVKINQ